ncbi:LpxI family protein [Pleomorphomonas koreensis]|uniref:LpxI family protein n=1 Tax=Pleomorphomonas koreensis TaxID=257440 RepID=UPI0004164FE0|nr:UDP-2,3-diacylglucosamine diphosphatase LpxI [Pleomorphomonas koreensis]
MTLRPSDPDRPTLGIIAGGGGVPAIVARAAEAAGRPVVLFGIVGEADAEIEAFHHHWLRWGEIGRMFDLLARERVGEVVICGAVNRPDFSAIRVDLGAVLSLPKILSLMVGGDDTVLKNVVRFLEDRDYLVVGAHQVAPELVGGDGSLGRYRPSEDAEADIVRGVEASLMLGRLDIGQAVVAISGRVVAVEGIEGTDELLQRVADLRKRGRLKAAHRSGVLVKAAKPQQDLRVDLPTIGPRTVEMAAAAGLAGIAVEAGRVMIVDRAATVAAADAARLFIDVRRFPEAAP